MEGKQEKKMGDHHILCGVFTLCHKIGNMRKKYAFFIVFLKFFLTERGNICIISVASPCFCRVLVCQLRREESLHPPSSSSGFPAAKSKRRKRCIACSVPISPRSASVPRSTVSVRECVLPMAAKCSLAAVQRVALV